jgi:hypothetical protein
MQYTWFQLLDKESIAIVNVCMPFKLLIKLILELQIKTPQYILVEDFNMIE